MQRIAVVCGAGASSTFIALGLRRAAAQRGIEIIATAHSLSGLGKIETTPDVILLGPHLATEEKAVREGFPSARVVMLSDQVVRTEDGSAALEIVLSAGGQQ